MRLLAAVLVCLVIVPAGVLAWAHSQVRPTWTVASARRTLSANGFGRVTVRPAGSLKATTAADRRLFRTVRGALIARSQGGGLAVVIVTSNADAARALYQLAVSEGARFGRGPLRGGIARNVFIESGAFFPGAPDRFPKLMQLFDA